MALKAAERFLLSLLFKEEGEIDPPARDPGVPDWGNLLVSATNEAVAGAAFYRIQKKSLEGRVPQDIFNALQGAYYANLKRYLSTLPELKKALSSLRERAIPFIVLKGVALAEHLYPSAAMRGMSDMDILVRKDDVPKVDEAFTLLGYSPRDGIPAQTLQNPSGYLASLEYHRDDVPSLPIHVHWHLINTSVPATAFAIKMNMERIWERSVSVSVADVDSRILCPEHLIVYLCEHALRTGHSFDRLVLMLDIHQALKAYEKKLDWDFLITESRDFGLDRFVFFALTIVGFYRGLKISQNALDSLRPDILAPCERMFLRLQLDNRRFRGSSYLVYLAANKGMLHKGRFVFRTLFPPLAVLRQRSMDRKDRHPAFLYVDRVMEIMGLMLRMSIFHR